MRLIVPPLMVELLTCSVPELAEIVPPALFTVVLANCKVDPLVASMVPVLVAPPLASIVIPDDWFELMVPVFTSVTWPWPICPAPEIVSSLVRVSV